jgi:hypothetical protein
MEEALDQPVTLTERQFRSLRRRGAAAIVGTVLAAVVLALVAFGIGRVETTLTRQGKEMSALRASLPESVRTQVAALFDQATREEIRRVAKEGAEQTLAGTRGDVSRLAGRVRVLSDSLESVLALLDAGSIRMGALQVEQDSLAARLGRSETRIALLDSVGLERHTAAEARMADLGLRMQAAENIQTEQGAQLRTAKKRQSILLGAVPVFLGPYIHILDHGGRR